MQWWAQSAVQSLRLRSFGEYPGWSDGLCLTDRLRPSIQDVLSSLAHEHTPDNERLMLCSGFLSAADLAIATTGLLFDRLTTPYVCFASPPVSRASIYETDDRAASLRSYSRSKATCAPGRRTQLQALPHTQGNMDCAIERKYSFFLVGFSWECG